LKIWNVLTGQEVATLEGFGTCIAFSPDGWRLIANDLRQVRVWDARPRDAEVRNELLALRLVNHLLANGMLKEEVIALVAADSKLAQPLRETALEFARGSEENAEALNNSSWSIVRQATRSGAEYARALLQSEAACRIRPYAGYYVGTLGVAQYRVGRFADAVTTLTRASELNAKQRGGPHPANIAFLALAQHQLAHRGEAKKLLDELRKLLQQDRWKNDDESQAFLREAEVMIEPKPNPPQLRPHPPAPPGV
jgi:tetratricopeptide (TPR) repeat protein